MREKILLRAAEQQFFNASPLTLATLSDTQTAEDLMSYVQSFSSAAREIFEELIRKFAESSNETAGEHFTPGNTLSVLGELGHPPAASRQPGPGAPLVLLKAA